MYYKNPVNQNNGTFIFNWYILFAQLKEMVNTQSSDFTWLSIVCIQPFTGNFTQQEAISESAIEAAVEVLRSGRLHRYNTIGDESSEAALLEQEDAAWQGGECCLACASGV